MRSARLLGVAVAAVLLSTACNGRTEVAPSTDPSTTVPSLTSTIVTTTTITPPPGEGTSTTTTTITPPPGAESGWSDIGWGVGITIGFIPDDFFGLWTESNVASEFHSFINGDQSVRFSVGWLRSGSPRWYEGQEVTRNGIEYYIETSWRYTRILREVGEDEVIVVQTRRLVGGEKLDVEMLWRIAESVEYDPDPGSVGPPPDLNPPDPRPTWEFFGQVVHIVFTGDYVVDEPGRMGILGPMEVTLADGDVLRFPAGGERVRWCRPVHGEIRSGDVEDCWVAGAWDEEGLVLSWETFQVGPYRVRGEVVGRGFSLRSGIEGVVDGAVVVRGYALPLAQDVVVDLGVCPPGVDTVEEVAEGGGGFFDVDRGEIVHISCVVTLLRL